MAEAGPQGFCRGCGLLTEYRDTRRVRLEFGASWPFEAGPADGPGLASLPLAPVVACACRLGRPVEERPYPCEAFSPGC